MKFKLYAIALALSFAVAMTLFILHRSNANEKITSCDAAIKYKELNVVLVSSPYGYSRMIVNGNLDCMAHLREEDIPDDYIKEFYKEECTSGKRGALVAEKMKVHPTGMYRRSLELSVIGRGMNISELERSWVKNSMLRIGEPNVKLCYI